MVSAPHFTVQKTYYSYALGSRLGIEETFQTSATRKSNELVCAFIGPLFYEIEDTYACLYKPVIAVRL